MKIRAILGFAIAVMSCATIGCAAVRSRPERDPVLDESSLGEPPEDWSSAVQFAFADSTWRLTERFSTRIQFNDGVRNRTITASDRLPVQLGGLRTPWYRLRPRRDTSTVSLRITLEHAGGGRTVAEYPLPMFTDEFFNLYVGVGAREPIPDGMAPSPLNLHGYSMDPAARFAPSDSLWVSYFPRSRRCFGCPT